MKIAFSTLGCPEWTWEDMLVIAKDLGFDGIELCGLEHEMYVPRAPQFTGAELERTVARLRQLNLAVPCLTSACILGDEAKSEANLQEGRDYIDLAVKLDARLIRVMGEGTAEPRLALDSILVGENLARLADYAAGKGVAVLIETNGYFAASDRLAALLGRVNRPNLGVLWDIHHPFRFFGEPAALTYGRLKDWIKHIHLKDSTIADGQLRYCMPGHGDVPLAEALGLLQRDGFTGYLSLEWVKRWYRELEDPGVAFAYFAEFMKEWR